MGGGRGIPVRRLPGRGGVPDAPHDRRPGGAVLGLDNSLVAITTPRPGVLESLGTTVVSCVALLVLVFAARRRPLADQLALRLSFAGSCELSGAPARLVRHRTGTPAPRPGKSDRRVWRATVPSGRPSVRHEDHRRVPGEGAATGAELTWFPHRAARRRLAPGLG